MIYLSINRQSITVVEGTTIAAALAQANFPYARTSVTGEKRPPFCGMGVCQECRIEVNGIRVLACQTLCQNQMQVETLR